MRDKTAIEIADDLMGEATRALNRANASSDDYDISSTVRIAATTLRDQYSRIAELEAELVAEAKKTASEKLRADQMTEQHRMQATMHSQAREELAQLRAKREPALPALKTPKDFKAWQGGQQPEDTYGWKVWVQLRNGVMDEGPADSFDWENDDHPYDIVAYKVVKP